MTFLNQLITLVVAIFIILLIVKLVKNILHIIFVVLGILIILTAITYTITLTTGTNPVGYATTKLKNIGFEKLPILSNKSIILSNIEIRGDSNR